MMFVLTVAISRLVPLLFIYSLVLVVGRFLYDRYRASHPGVARLVFGAVLALGLSGSLPFVLGSGALVLAELSFTLERWERVDAYHDLHARIAGPPSERLSRNWATALMNVHEFGKAERVLLSTVRMREGRAVVAPFTVYQLGVCRYYQGRWEAAERTLSEVEDSPFFTLRNYLLGRLAERRGDEAAAVALYDRALEQDPRLVAALYHSVRLLLVDGREREAAARMARFTTTESLVDRSPALGALRRALDSGTPPPDTEFFFVDSG